jgi:outer membrane protein OmpA-like peptidoglycan-associated protein
MISKMHPKAPILIFLICPLFFTGCTAALIGAGAGASAGAVAYVQGSLTRIYEEDYHRVVRATEKTLIGLRFQVDKTVSDELKTTIDARRGDGSPVTAEVVRLDPGKIQVGIRSGAIGMLDKDVSRQIHDAIGQRLAERPIPNPEEVKLSDRSTTAAEDPSPVVETPVDTPPVAESPQARPETVSEAAGSDSTRPTTRPTVEWTVLFPMDSNSLSPEAVRLLDQIAETLLETPEKTVMVNGFADSIGDADYNRIISEGRANTVKVYLIGKGIGPNRLKVVGHGETDFVGDNSTAEGRRLNRRVELVPISSEMEDAAP